MAGCHITAGKARFFVTSPYTESGEQLVASLPSSCPLTSEQVSGPEPRCRVRPHHLRARKTGPCHPLQVAICRTHGVAFTLYPPGHVPYGRCAVAPASQDGRLLRVAPDDNGQSGSRAEGEDRPSSGAIPWESTQFVAACDAAQGHAWPREGSAQAPRTTTGSAETDPAKAQRSSAPGRWATQLRWLERSARTLGLSPALPESQRSRVANLLGLRLLELTAAASCWAGAHGYQARGEVIVGVLGKLGGQPGLPGGLLATGHMSGLWGPPSRWEPRQDGAGLGVLRCPFHGAGTPRTPAPGQPGRVVTTLAS